MYLPKDLQRLVEAAAHHIQVIVQNSRSKIALFHVRDRCEMSPLPWCRQEVSDFVRDSTNSKTTHLQIYVIYYKIQDFN